VAAANAVPCRQRISAPAVTVGPFAYCGWGKHRRRRAHRHLRPIARIRTSARARRCRTLLLGDADRPRGRTSARGRSSANYDGVPSTTNRGRARTPSSAATRCFVAPVTICDGAYKTAAGSAIGEICRRRSWYSMGTPSQFRRLGAPQTARNNGRRTQRPAVRSDESNDFSFWLYRPRESSTM